MTRVLGALVFALVTQAARADDPVRPEEWNEAVAALEAGNYTRAADLLAGLHAREGSVRTACNLALAYDRWGGHEEEAIAAYDDCARLDASGRFHEHAQTRARELRAARPAPGVEPAPPADAPSSSPTTPTAEATPPPVAPTLTPITAPPPTEAPSRGLLFAGIGTAIAGAALLIAGAVVATSGQSDLETIGNTVPPGTDASPALLDPESPEAALYRDAEGKRTTALALYVGSGALLALGATLIAINLVGGSADSRAAVAVTRDGAFAAAQFRF